VVRAPPHPHPRRHITRRPSQLGALSFAWSSTAPSVQPFLAHAPWRGLSELGARGELHLKRRSLTWRRHYPDPAPVHLDDLLGDGEPEARAALGLSKRAIDLVELLEDPSLLVKRYAGPGIRHRDREMAVPRACGDAHFAGVGELDRVAYEV